MYNVPNSSWSTLCPVRDWPLSTTTSLYSQSAGRKRPRETLYDSRYRCRLPYRGYSLRYRCHPLYCGRRWRTHRTEHETHRRVQPLQPHGGSYHGSPSASACSSIQYGVSRIEQVEHRLNMKRTPGGISIIDDAFNSNPDGARMALDVLRRMTQGNASSSHRV